MGTHPIFESDFDCLTECRKLLVPGPTPVETTTPLTPTVVTTIPIPMAAHLLEAGPINITLLHLETPDGTTIPTLTVTPVERVTDQPTLDTQLDNYCNVCA